MYPAASPEPKNNWTISETWPLISALGCISSLARASRPPLASKKSRIEPSLSRARARSYLKKRSRAKRMFYSKRFEVCL